MLTFVERSTIQYLNKRGFTNTAIGEIVGHHRDTVKKALSEPVFRQKIPRKRTSAVAVFDEQIKTWLEQQVKIKRMLELAQADPDHPYAGGETAFYDYVRGVRKARGLVPAKMAVRFDGLPGEFLQVDWGEIRNFPFTKPQMQGQTRYFFAARLKHSRFMFVRFTTDMVEETLLRCLVACFVTLGGVPWVVTVDNMKTATLGRDENNQPIWHPAFARLASEFGFHPEACAPASGNQKGAVENLVKFVKSNFVNGRTFYDCADLDSELTTWLKQVNYERECSANETIPAQLLSEEQARLGTLPPTAKDYGFFESLMVNREGLVTFQTNKYSVPARLVGHALTARIFEERLELYEGEQPVASHPRSPLRNQRIVIPAHFEAAFEHKPRARVMVYRDWLVKLSEEAATYISEICRTQRGRMNEQILALYALAQQVGTADFLIALELAAEQQLLGAEYVTVIALGPTAGLAQSPQKPAPVVPKLRAQPQPPLELQFPIGDAPTQREIERDLAQYEDYVANRHLLLEPIVVAEAVNFLKSPLYPTLTLVAGGIR